MNNGLVLDSTWRETVRQKFERKQQLAKSRHAQLFHVFDEPLSEEERFLLQFLYAYMPMNDLADYSGELFLSHVRTTLLIRGQVPWGMSIPEHHFVHFVLPYRVNNENIEDSRGLLFQELIGRVQGLSLTEAILETNYWCHERATYVGNDPRTVSPLTLMRTTLGRCGEQSTLAVAALRSLGIPARQCYTPRWAHCDSNHAWVEAWDGHAWRFLGACEPEARLDQGWFKDPAARAMLVNTRVPSNYPGPEEITLAHPWYTEINLLNHYAPSKTIKVHVVHADGTPAEAQLSFQLYNFAELSTIVTKQSDASGQVSLTTGFGNLFVHAAGPGAWNTMVIHPADADEFTIVLNAGLGDSELVQAFDMVPPPAAELGKEDVPVHEQLRNQERVQEGARIRADYEATFMNEEAANRLAAELSLPADRVWTVISRARGNSHELALFLREQSPAHGHWPLTLLESLNVKDLTDTLRPALNDHLNGALPFLDAHDLDFVASYLLCPRIHYEMIVPYKQRFQQRFTPEEQMQYREDPQALYDRIAGEFEVIEDMNYFNGSATPIGSLELAKGDRLSLHIMLTAAARSVGIPARLDPNDRRPQYWQDGAWIDYRLTAVSEAAASLELGASPEPKASPELNALSEFPDSSLGFIQLVRAGNEEEQEAAYFNNFTLARWEDGLFKTLTLPFGKKDWWDSPLEVLSGRYRLTTGTRMQDGTAKVRLTYFQVKAGESTEVALVFRREEEEEVPVLGAAAMTTALFSPEVQLDLAAGTHGAIVAWIEPDREPSKHLLRELRELAPAFDAWGGPILLAAGEDKLTASFTLDRDTTLPLHASFHKDPGYIGLDALTSDMDKRPSAAFPVVFVLDAKGQIRYFSTGYKLGIGREVLDVVGRM
ncbi:transglutaminase domain-containing protein [Paenibacillus sp. R14(2021)]|uniref:transglutaminase domain-containing protein n=1 Tax=Paenibacillus sp. R14(2021) TaxID=2859228 RepID=UPI001C614371|nr:transglutaminase domain-containing protein [Paenibacillus sp. R14(2021)]